MARWKSTAVRDHAPSGYVRGSFDSEPSRVSDTYTTSEMSDDMHQILSPSFDSCNDLTVKPTVLDPISGLCQPHVESSCSTDSIILRVEEEIVAAQKASSDAKARMSETKFLYPDVERQPSEHVSEAAIRIAPSEHHSVIASSVDCSNVQFNIDPPSIMSNYYFSANTKCPISSSHLSKTEQLDNLSLQEWRKESTSRRQTRLVTLSNSNRQQLSSSALHANVNDGSDGKPSLNPKDFQFNVDSVLSSNSEDDMRNILGVNDDEDEKKSSTEPCFSSGLLPSPDDGVSYSRREINFSVFDKIDYLRKKVDSSDNFGDRVNEDDVDVEGFPQDRRWMHFRNDNIIEARASFERSISVNNADFVYENSSHLTMLSSPVKSCDNTSRADTAAGSALGADSIYFTDEEWQQDIQFKESTEGSFSRSVTSSKMERSANDTRKFPYDDCNPSSPTITDAERMQTTIEKGTWLQSRQSASETCTEAQLDETSREWTDQISDIAASTGFESELLNALRSQAVNKSLTHNRTAEFASLGDIPVDQAPLSSAIVTSLPTLLNVTNKNTNEDFPLLQTSSTEDAIVNVQHHPVFQKRISLTDSASVDPSFPLSDKDCSVELTKSKNMYEITTLDHTTPLTKQKESSAHCRYNLETTTMTVAVPQSPNVKSVQSLPQEQNRSEITSQSPRKSSPFHYVSYRKIFSDFNVCDEQRNALSFTGTEAKDLGEGQSVLRVESTGIVTDMLQSSPPSSVSVSKLDRSLHPEPEQSIERFQNGTYHSSTLNDFSQPEATISGHPVIKHDHYNLSADGKQYIDASQQEGFCGGVGDFSSKTRCTSNKCHLPHTVHDAPLNRANTNSNIHYTVNDIVNPGELLTDLPKNVAISTGIGDGCTKSDCQQLHIDSTFKTDDSSFCKIATIENANSTESHVATVLPAALNNSSGNEWDKASELLYKLKEQRVNFSVSFSSIQNNDHEGHPTPIALSNNNRDEDSFKLEVQDHPNVVHIEDVYEGNDALILSDCNAGDQHSILGVNQGHRSPRYFNFMRVKRAKQRARKMQISNISVGPDPVSRIDIIPNCEDPSQSRHRQDGAALQDGSIACPVLSSLQRFPNTPKRDNVEETAKENDCVVNAKQIDPPAGGSQLKQCYTPERNAIPSPMQRADQNRHVCSPKAENNLTRNCSTVSPRSHASSTSPKHSVANKSEGEDEFIKHSSRIRFRNPFPMVKPPTNRRDTEAIINDHAIEIPDIPIRWAKPNKELKQLIVAAMGTSLARRSNACGALKVLTRHKKNQLTLVRTDGFLTALTFAATQAISHEERDLALDARTRAVAALHNVCAPKDNRLLMMKHPGMVECFVHVIQTDTGEGRALATCSLALLAKTPSCRKGIVNTERLVEGLARVMSNGCHEISSEPNESGEAMTNLTIEEKASETRRNDLRGSRCSISSSSSGSVCRKANIDDSIKAVDSIRNQAEERKDEYLTEARAYACATLVHLSKECAISHQLCHSNVLLDSLVFVANDMTSPLNSKCLEIICSLTRLPANNHILCQHMGIIETLLSACNSADLDNRISALRSLQNMSSDAASKSILATSQVLTKMISCAMRKDGAEKEMAVATIYNISTEPSAVAAITNTKNVVATLVHIAHSPDSSSEARLLACEALSTISLWLQTLAGTGRVPQGVSNVPLPSQKSSGWMRWD